MKFLLVVCDTRGKNLVFVTKELKALSLEEALAAARRGEVEKAFVVNKKSGSYIRTRHGVPVAEQFEKLAAPFRDLLLYAQGARRAESIPPLKQYLDAYAASLQKGQPIIIPVGQPMAVLTAQLERKLLQQRENIFFAAQKFNIDPFLLAAIVIDETARLLPLEPIFDALGARVAGGNTSVGLAQIKIDTAHNLIMQGAYNPNPGDPRLTVKKLDRAAREYLHTYVSDPKHNLLFAAAEIRYIIDHWKSQADLSKRPEIIGTLYSQGVGKPNPEPRAIGRGIQIAGEFYQLAKQWFEQP